MADWTLAGEGGVSFAVENEAVTGEAIPTFQMDLPISCISASNDAALHDELFQKKKYESLDLRVSVSPTTVPWHASVK